MHSSAACTGKPPRPVALPWPSELPAGSPRHPRVQQLIDTDAVSHGLAYGTGLGRTSDQEVQRCPEVVQATARSLGSWARAWYVASSKTETATHHPASLADLVLLVATEHINASAIRQLRLRQIPTWLVVPGCLSPPRSTPVHVQLLISARSTRVRTPRAVG